MSKITYQTPEKIVIVAGPSFGQALKFILLGAAIGAAAATYFKPKTIVAPSRSRGMAQDLATRFIASKIGFGKAKGAKPDTFRAADLKADTKIDAAESTTFGASDYDPAIEDFEASAKTAGDTASGAASEAGEALADRIESLTSRLKVLGSRAKHLVETASEAVKPTLETALAEGKRVAAEVQTGLKKDVAEAGDKPAIAEQDGELPSEKEDKFIE